MFLFFIPNIKKHIKIKICKNKLDEAIAFNPNPNTLIVNAVLLLGSCIYSESSNKRHGNPTIYIKLDPQYKCDNSNVPITKIDSIVIRNPIFLFSIIFYFFIPYKIIENVIIIKMLIVVLNVINISSVELKIKF